jgi:cytochrome P450
MLKNSRPENEPNLVQAALRSRHKDGGRVMGTIEEMTSFLVGAAFGGYDTTAMAMSWAVLKLAEHPEVQAAVQKELDAVVGGDVPTLVSDCPCTVSLQGQL